MASLVRGLHQDRPGTLRGIIWFRLPVAGDRLNWSWTTLSMVMDGRTPRPALAVEVISPGPGLSELTLVNRGDADAVPFNEVRVEWGADRLVAADGLRGFSTEPWGKGVCLFVRAEGEAGVVAPGERWTIGWLRFESSSEVRPRVAVLQP